MVESILGTRIGEHRRQLGITQAEMARRIGISPSYLNLIERNKRRIAGTLLRRTAEELGLRIEDLDDASERRLAEALREIASLPVMDGLDVEATKVPELIARFPGWARAVSSLTRSERAAQNTARALSDRLASDPFLGTAVHGMLSRVAAIRSAAEILTEFEDIDTGERQDFHRIVRSEAEALTETGEALASYFDRATETEARLTPLDETEALFDARSNHFEELETSGDHRDVIGEILASAGQIETEAARGRATAQLSVYAEDAAAMPLTEFVLQARDTGCDIETLAKAFVVGTDAVCRRLTTLPTETGLPTFGYVLANASGSLIEIRAIQGLSLPRYAATCPLWILFRAQQQPGVAMAQHAEMPTGDRFVFVAVARAVGAVGYDQPRHYMTDMLAMPAEAASATIYSVALDRPAEPIGPACNICPRNECLHRVADPLAG